MLARVVGSLLFLAAAGAAAQGPLIGNCSLHCSTSGIPALVDAARTADRATALALLAERADPNQTESDGSTPLHWAVHHDDAELVARLIEAGAQVGAANDYGATPMSEAAVAANAAVLRALLAAGANVDSPNADGQTALMVVARGGSTAAAQVLIEHGADVNAREQRKGQTAWMWAVAQTQPRSTSDSERIEKFGSIGMP